MSRQSMLIAVAVVLVLLLVAGVLFLLQRASPTVSHQPEQETRDRTRAEPEGRPSGPGSDLASGGTLIGDWYELRFTSPRYPDDPANRQGGVDERLVQLMDSAVNTLDVAVYDFDLATVADAMVRADRRKVRVRMVTDTDTLANTRDADIQTAFDKLKIAGIPIVADQRSDIMHHKFTVVDGEWVQTGSWNYTVGDTYRLNNHQFIARSRELAANYTAEFEKMFVRRRFGAAKPIGRPYPTIRIGNATVETYFAPSDRIVDRVVEMIQQRTERGLFFMAFSFTHDAIGSAVIGQAERGATVQWVFETTGSNTKFSEYGRMKQAGLDVYQDGNPWIMHHKVIGLDQQVSIFGSFNFSSNAATGNDENLLIVDEPAIAEAFRAEFERVLAVAKNPPARQR